MDALKFVVLDEEDLEVASTHLQEPSSRLPMCIGGKERRLVLGLNRFDWETANDANNESGGAGPRCASSAFCPVNAST